MNATREHIAWKLLVRKLAYLNTFGGNRAEMEKTTKMVLDIWDEARRLSEGRPAWSREEEKKGEDHENGKNCAHVQ